jgi:putative ABC transport system permease protein
LFVVAQIQQVGDVRLFVNAIVGAVMFTLLFLTGSTMMQSVRDRFVELGVLKALGFTDAMVFATVVLESLVLCLAAAVLGLAVTAAVFPGLFDALGVGAVPLPPSVWLSGLGTATALALLVAIWPAWRARTLSIAEVLGGRK